MQESGILYVDIPHKGMLVSYKIYYFSAQWEGKDLIF